jgi:hypothetical protein
VNKKKLSEIKTKIKKNAPVIALSAVTIAATVYSVALKKTLNERTHDCSTTHRLALNDCCMEELKSGDDVIWTDNGHIINLAYDPDC